MQNAWMQTTPHYGGMAELFDVRELDTLFYLASLASENQYLRGDWLAVSPFDGVHVCV